MPTTNPKNEALGRSLARWSKRSSAIAIVPPFLGLYFALANQGDSESAFAAAGLGASFMGVLFGLLGLFGYTLAADLASSVRRPRWTIVFCIVGILGGFSMGLYGMLTGASRT